MFPDGQTDPRRRIKVTPRAWLQTKMGEHVFRRFCHPHPGNQVENLVALVDTMRGFEAYMQAAQKLDQVTGKAISDVGKV